jgi:hypothetical protein
VLASFLAARYNFDGGSDCAASGSGYRIAGSFRVGWVMLIVRSRNGVAVRLTDERWQHIATRHPEMSDQRERVIESVVEPDSILEGDDGALQAVRFYSSTPLTQKHLVVVYREVSLEDGFVITAYLTRQPSRSRRVIWTRSGSSNVPTN